MFPFFRLSPTLLGRGKHYLASQLWKRTVALIWKPKLGLEPLWFRGFQGIRHASFLFSSIHRSPGLQSNVQSILECPHARRKDSGAPYVCCGRWSGGHHAPVGPHSRPCRSQCGSMTNTASCPMQSDLWDPFRSCSRKGQERYRPAAWCGLRRRVEYSWQSGNLVGKTTGWEDISFYCGGAERWVGSWFAWRMSERINFVHLR
jgi:hypothetical protein